MVYLSLSHTLSCRGCDRPILSASRRPVVAVETRDPHMSSRRVVVVCAGAHLRQFIEDRVPFLPRAYTKKDDTIYAVLISLPGSGNVVELQAPKCAKCESGLGVEARRRRAVCTASDDAVRATSGRV